MEHQAAAQPKKTYKVLIDSLVTEGRVFQRGDMLAPEDAPGEIESLLHAGVIEATDQESNKFELR